MFGSDEGLKLIWFSKIKNKRFKAVKNWLKLKSV